MEQTGLQALRRAGAVAAGSVLLLALIVLLGASRCCRQAFLATDTWVWAAAGACALVYFCVRAGPPAAASAEPVGTYRPLHGAVAGAEAGSDNTVRVLTVPEDLALSPGSCSSGGFGSAREEDALMARHRYNAEEGLRGAFFPSPGRTPDSPGSLSPDRPRAGGSPQAHALWLDGRHDRSPQWNLGCMGHPSSPGSPESAYTPRCQSFPMIGSQDGSSMGVLGMRLELGWPRRLFSGRDMLFRENSAPACASSPSQEELLPRRRVIMGFNMDEDPPRTPDRLRPLQAQSPPFDRSGACALWPDALSPRTPPSKGAASPTPKSNFDRDFPASSLLAAEAAQKRDCPQWRTVEPEQAEGLAEWSPVAAPLKYRYVPPGVCVFGIVLLSMVLVAVILGFDPSPMVRQDVAREHDFMGESPAPAPNSSQGSVPFWHVGNWGHCSEGCGGGEMTREVRCVNGPREECLRNVSAAPRDTKKCREYSGCQWRVGPWGDCDAECGVGEVTRQVLCTNSQIQDCFKDLYTVPTDTKACTNVDGCRWTLHEWGSCSNGCGAGEQHRNVTCANGDAKYCKEHGALPPQTRPCRNFDGCEWITSRWSPCSESCGVGLHNRTVECTNGKSDECLERVGKPPHSEERCHDVSGCRWAVSNWTSCSSQCGTGNRSRNVSCANGEREDCLAHSPAPAAESNCTETADCAWTSPWSECTASCGMGYRTRQVSCDGSDHMGECELGDKKVATFTETCHNSTGCTWTVSSWGDCSATCGRGRQERKVECGSGDSKDCTKHGVRPSSSRPCNDSSGCGGSGAAGLHAGESVSCPCSSGEPMLRVGGILNALIGWVVSFAGLHELAHRVACPMLCSPLSPQAILAAGIGAFTTSSMLFMRTPLDSASAKQVVLSTSQITVGLAGLFLWTASCCGSGTPLRGSRNWQNVVAWMVSSIVLIGLCSVMLFLGFWFNDTDDGGHTVEHAAARKLRGELVL